MVHLKSKSELCVVKHLSARRIRSHTRSEQKE